MNNAIPTYLKSRYTESGLLLNREHELYLGWLRDREGDTFVPPSPVIEETFNTAFHPSGTSPISMETYVYNILTKTEMEPSEVLIKSLTKTLNNENWVKGEYAVITSFFRSNPIDYIRATGIWDNVGYCDKRYTIWEVSRRDGATFILNNKAANTQDLWWEAGVHSRVPNEGARCPVLPTPRSVNSRTYR